MIWGMLLWEGEGAGGLWWAILCVIRKNVFTRIATVLLVMKVKMVPNSGNL